MQVSIKGNSRANGSLFVFRQLGFTVKDEDGANNTRRTSRGGNEGETSALFGDIKNLVFKEWGQKQQYLDITKVLVGSQVLDSVPDKVIFQIIAL